MTQTSSTASTSRSSSTTTSNGIADLAPVISPEPFGKCHSTSKSLVIQHKKKMTKKKVFNDRWICDICRIAAFDEFDEACRHEESCGKAEMTKPQVGPEANSNIEASNVGTKDKNHPNKETRINNDGDDALVTKSNEVAEVVDFEDTPILPKKLEYLNSNKRSAPDANGNVNDGCEFVNCEICSPSKDNDNDKNTRTANIKAKRQAMPRHTNSKTHPLKSKKQEQSPEVQIIATRMNSHKPKVPTAPLFLQSKNVTNTKTVSSTTSKRTKKKNPKTPRTIAFASIFQKNTKATKAINPFNESKSTDSDLDNGNDNPSPPSISSEEKKAILAEHRMAEFASNRRKQQQEEKERQKKREENRRLNYEAKQQEKEEVRIERQQQQTQKQRQRPPQGTSFFQTDKSTPKIKDNSGNRLESPLDLAETPEVRLIPKAENNVRRNKKAKMRNDNGLDVGKYPPRFPNPSFVAAADADVDEGEKGRSAGALLSCRGKHYESFATSRYQESVDSVALPDLPLYHHETVVNVDNPIDDIHMENGDFVYKCFSSVLHPCIPSIDVDAEVSPNLNQLWSDKYSMKSIPQDVYGHSNREVAEDLVGFINNWKGHRQQIYEVRAERAAKLRGSKKKKAKKRSRTYVSDDGDFLSDDEDSGLRSVYLLTGKTGSGKTSMVHAAAHHCHCALIEINTTAERGGKALKKEIEECTQSLSNLALLKRETTSLGGILKEDENEESSGSSLAVILIDEGTSNDLITMFSIHKCIFHFSHSKNTPPTIVDLMFESNGDTGFWQSLANLAKKSKCPIILTASSLPLQIDKSSNIQYEHSMLVRPTPFECVSKITQIKRAEEMQWDSKNRDEIKPVLAAMSKYCGCDLRRIMNEMQLFALGKSQSSGTARILHKPQLKSGNIVNIQYPQVCSVSPRTVPSGSYSLVAIKGKHFNEDGEVEVIVGSQVAPSRLVEKDTILAMIPPCQIPRNVDALGHIKNTIYEESLCTRYASIKVSVKRSNGMVLASDIAIGICQTDDGSIPLQTFVEYSFPDEGDFEIDHDEEEHATKDETEALAMLQEAEDKYSIKTTDSTASSNSAFVSCSPMSTQSDYSLDQMVELSNSLESMSDMIFFKDVCGNLALPSISGALRDSGTGLNDAVSSVCGWEDPSLCRGASNAYLTTPTSRRDRWLLSQECNFSKEYKFHLDSSNTTTEEEDNDDDAMFSFKSNEEETYFPFPSFTQSFILPSQLAEAKRYDTLMTASAHAGLLDYDIDVNRGNASHVIAPLMSHTRL